MQSGRVPFDEKGCGLRRSCRAHDATTRIVRQAGKQGVRALFGRTVASPMSSTDRRSHMKSFLLAILVLFPTFAFAAVPTTSLDIGQVGAAGSTSVSNGVYTVRASGVDIWGTQDEFRFVYLPLDGDGEITARVDSVQATDGWMKAGVMIRQTLNANSPFAHTLVSAGYGVDFESRQSAGGQVGPAGVYDRVSRAPYWVRLRRAGNVFT